MARGLSIGALATLTGVHRNNIQRYETGLRQLKLHHLKIFAEALRCEPGDILPSGPALSAEQRALVELFDRLAPADQEKLLRIAEAIETPNRKAS